MKQKIRINESTLRKIVAESVTKVLLTEGVGNAELTQAYKNIINSVKTIVKNRFSIECGEDGYNAWINGVGSEEELYRDTEDYTKKYIFPAINDVFYAIQRDWDEFGTAQDGKESGEGTGGRNWI